MAEYWKSLPRKYCEACKCWFADNKSSIDFHERGKRHQENVAKRLKEIRKKGQREYEAKIKYDKEMRKIEAAALKAFQKDMKNDPKLAENYIPQAVPTLLNDPPPAPITKPKNFTPKNAKNSGKRNPSKAFIAAPSSTKKWVEAKSPEGYTYYYHTESGVSQWEVPSEGYIPLSVAKNSSTTVYSSSSSSNSSSSATATSSHVGPQPRSDPYGQWTPVVKTEPKQIDLQLPKKPGEALNIPTIYPEEPPKIQFKEKTVTHLDIDDEDVSAGDVQFKKRKKFGEGKRNVRPRTDDD